MFSCARICVEVDLEKGLPEVINLLMDGWNHLQTMDYEQIPFKCKFYHEYRNFVKFFPKKPARPSTNETPKEEWNEVNRRKCVRIAPQQAHPTSTKNTTEKNFKLLQVKTMKKRK